MEIHYTRFKSLIGELLIGVAGGKVCMLCMSEGDSDPEVFSRYPHLDGCMRIKNDSPAFRPLIEQVEAYLSGQTEYMEFAVETDGTPFQKQVWQALRHIPYGQTRSYAEIARSIGRPLAARAIGQACGANPVMLAVPCHRVLAENGKIGGFARGKNATGIKQWLLELEQGLIHERVAA